jgi:hypothetical protein
MCAKFRILLKPIETSDKVADHIVKAIVCLHNFLLTYSAAENHPTKLADYGLGLEENGLWRDGIRPLEQARDVLRANRKASNFGREAGQMRVNLMNHFQGVGAVGWQDDLI